MLVLQVVTIDELKEDDVYEEIYDDMKDECGKYGKGVSSVFGVFCCSDVVHLIFL